MPFYLVCFHFYLIVILGEPPGVFYEIKKFFMYINYKPWSVLSKDLVTEKQYIRNLTMRKRRWDMYRIWRSSVHSINRYRSILETLFKAYKIIIIIRLRTYDKNAINTFAICNWTIVCLTELSMALACDRMAEYVFCLSSSSAAFLLSSISLICSIKSWR